MKRQFIMAIATMAASVSLAQTTLWDGESYDLGSQGGLWGDGSPSVVSNPDNTGINSSDKCISFTMTSDSKVIKFPLREWMTPSMNGSARVSLMVRKTNSCNVQIELSDPMDDSDSYWQDVAVWYDGAGEWKKLVYDFSTNSISDSPGVLTLTASTDNVDTDEVVYVDNIVIEPAPQIGGTVLSSVDDASLTGNLTATGAWMTGQCSNVSNNWATVSYDDYATLKEKAAAGITSVDFCAADCSNFYNALGDVNPNTIIYTNFANEAWGNVVVDGAAGSITLSDSYDFSVPTQFETESITLNRTLYSGYNTLYLPFAATSSELGVSLMATYKSVGEETVTFENVSEAAANTPLLVQMESETTEVSFGNKTVEATPESQSSEFKGTYTTISGEGLYGINENNQFAVGTSEAMVKPFRAYLETTGEAKTITFDNVVDAIEIVTNGAAAKEEVYFINGMKASANAQLAKGIYIINGKKVVVR